LTLAADWLVLPGPGVRLHRYALGWCAAVVGHGSAVAFVSDEEELTGEEGGPVRLRPRFRQAVDFDTLLETNPFGETIVIEATAYTELNWG